MSDLPTQESCGLYHLNYCLGWGVLQLLMTNGHPNVLESLVPAWVSLAEKVVTFLDLFSPSVLRDMRVIIAVLYRVA